MRNQDLTPGQREYVQFQQSLARLTPKGFTVYEHQNQGWFVDDGWSESHGPFDSADEALEAAVKLDNYDGPPDGDAWGGGFAENH